MDKKPKFVGTDAQGQEYEIAYPELLYTVEFTPMIDRIETEKPELLSGFHNIFKAVEPEIFQNYFNQLVDIKVSDDKMMIITKNLIQKSILERDYIEIIKEAFEVKHVRIIAQG